MPVQWTEQGQLIWKPRRTLPSLADSNLIALDLETKDDNLKEKGPGAVRGEGYIVGMSYATDTGLSDYIPLKHLNEKNIPLEKFKDWFQKNFYNRKPKVGANIFYEMEWLRTIGLEVQGPLYDIQIAEPLLDENKFRYGLEALSKQYLEEKYWKATGFLEQKARELLGKTFKKDDVRAHIWRLPSKIVGGYGELDSIASLKVFLKQRPLIENQNLWELFLLEGRLLPLMLEMKFRGVMIDVNKAEQVLETHKEQITKLDRSLKRHAGFEINVNAPRNIAKAFDKEGVRYPRTAQTKTGRGNNPSFTKEWLDILHKSGKTGSKLAGLILERRHLDKSITTFIESHLELNIKGRLHPQFHTMKADDSGTVTGRFSCSKPNLQQQPSKDETGGDLIRSYFIPESDCDWLKNDYSQIEYRLLVDYAFRKRFKGAKAAMEAYQKDPNTDFHQMICDLLIVLVDWMTRKTAKNTNFGLVYGMGKALLCSKLGLTPEEGEEFFKTFHKRAPFIKALSKDVANVAQRRGYIRTILKRRRRFNLWEPSFNYGKDKKPALTYKAALAYQAEGLNIQRAFTFKALNALIQGSAADIMKKAMVDCFEAGLFADDALGIPHLTVHDELDFSKPRTTDADKALRETLHLMENCVQLTVPIIVDCEIGPDWWNLKSWGER